ncbi:MAG: ferredoxin, partial [Thaumarchaeota archaeon]|nr:ferredoxin [Nitrososphaerota archaeon]
MPIKEDFCKDVKPIGKISLEGGEYFHWVWPSQGLVEASKDEKTLAAYKDHKEK